MGVMSWGVMSCDVMEGVMCNISRIMQYIVLM